MLSSIHITLNNVLALLARDTKVLIKHVGTFVLLVIHGLSYFQSMH